MSIRILTNIPSMDAQRTLDINQEQLSKSFMRLSSGERITSGADDAAGLAISERIRAQVRSLKQAQRNANDGINMVQIAEGGLSEISNMIIRIRELSVQASSDTVGDRERQFIDLEVQQMKKEINRISDSTGYNGIQMLNGESAKPTLEFQIASFNTPTDRIQFDVGTFNTKVDAIGLESTGVLEVDSARIAMEESDKALDQINGYRANLGALQNRLHSTSNGLGIAIENLASANSRIRDVDIAEESAELLKRNILSSATISVLAQANQIPAQALKLI